MKNCLIIFLTLWLPCQLSAQDNRGLAKLNAPNNTTALTQLYAGSYALVIGNGNYTQSGWSPLSGALSDVSEVAVALQKKGFHVILKTNLTAEGFRRALANFSNQYGTNPNNQLLIYYAGHGFSKSLTNGEDLGYLVMIDSPSPRLDPVGFEIKSIDMTEIITQAKKIQSRHVLFMFDSCFSGSIFNLRSGDIPNAISDSVRLPVRQFITAGRANERVPDRSVFKQAFLNILEGRAKELIPDGYLTGEELGFYLKQTVPKYNTRQHPQYGKINDIHLDKGDFVFVLNGSKTPPLPPPPSSTLHEDFEHGLRQWKVKNYRGYNQEMVWHISANRAKSGRYSLALGNEDSDKKDNADSVFIETKLAYALNETMQLSVKLKKSYGTNLNIILVAEDTGKKTTIKQYSGNRQFRQWKSLSLPTNVNAKKYRIAFEAWGSGQLYLDDVILSTF